MGTGRMTLEARLQVDRGDFRLEAEFQAGKGEVVALLGPNGAGKSTALRALAGLEPGDSEIRLGGTNLGTLAVDKRPIGMVFQEYLLFPHLDARDNVAFGPRMKGNARHRARDIASTWLERFGVQDCANAKPARLSGGQAQRVALARALAVDPLLLLLDEPLAALDASTRPAVRAELGRHLEAYDGVCILVTHDPLDALTLADRIVVLENGRITQDGPPAEVARAPRSDYAARLVGLDFYRGHAHDNVVRLDNGGTLATTDDAEGEVCAVFPPHAVALFRTRPEGSPRNCWPVTVDSLERHGAIVRVNLTGSPPVLADVTPAAVAELGLAPGTELWATVKATEVRTYPAP